MSLIVQLLQEMVCFSPILTFHFHSQSSPGAAQDTHIKETVVLLQTLDVPSVKRSSAHGKD